MPELPQRQRFYHKPPEWVCDDAVYFITVCCAKRGVSQLNQTALFEVMVQAIEHYEVSGKWRVALFLVMPDHWHAMVQFPKPEHMEKVLRDWKRYVAKHAGIVWQDGFFEHRLRSKQSADEKWHYIRQNPVRRGLMDAPEQWPLVWYSKEAAR